MIPTSVLFESRLIRRGEAFEFKDKNSHAITLNDGKIWQHIGIGRIKDQKQRVSIDFNISEEDVKKLGGHLFKGGKKGSFELKGSFEKKNVNAILILKGISPGTYKLTSVKKLTGVQYFMEKV